MALGVDSYGVTYAPAPAPGVSAIPSGAAGSVEITRDDDALAHALEGELRAAGFQTEVVDRPSADARVLIITPAGGGSSTNAHARALAHVRCVAGDDQHRDHLVVLIQDSDGRFAAGPGGGWNAGVSGLAKTAARELPQATVRLIDATLSRAGPEAAAQRIVAELQSGGDALEIALSNSGERLSPSLTPLAAGGTVHPLTPDSVVLVTGGGRGVTSDCVINLAAQTSAQFALVGRTQLIDWPDATPRTTDAAVLRAALARDALAEGRKPVAADINRRVHQLLASEDICSTCSAIAQAGASATYFSADIAAPGVAHTLVDEVTASLGPITALVHGAGVLADKRIADKTDDQVARVFAPKVEGLRALLGALDQSKLTHVALFSSAAARYGNAGQADYAMANEVLNRVAHGLSEAHPNANALSLNWGPWDGGMVGETLKAHFQAHGISLIDRKAGAAAFTTLMLNGASTVEVCIGGAAPGA